MEFYQIWRILVSFKWLLISLPIIATCAGLGLTYVLPEQYESTALVLVRPFEEIKFSSNSGDRYKEIRDFPVNLSAPIDAPSKTYMEVITSPAVAVRIVTALRLDIPKPKKLDSLFSVIQDELKTWVKTTTRTVRNYFKYGRDIPATPFELAVEDVEKNLVAAVKKDTYSFEIAYTSSDPQEAADVANMAAEIFLEHSNETTRAESRRIREFLEKRLAESRKALEEARAAVLAYKNSGGVFELKSEYTERLRIVSDLETSMAKAEGKLAGYRVVASRTDVKETPEIIAQMAEIATLKEQISTLQAQLTEYPQKEVRMNSLALNERLAGQDYEFFRKLYEESHVKEQASASDIRVVSQARPTLYPVKPLKWVYAGLSFLTALLVAIFWALISDSFKTMRDREDDLGLPALETMPTPKRIWPLRRSLGARESLPAGVDSPRPQPVSLSTDSGES